MQHQHQQHTSIVAGIGKHVSVGRNALPYRPGALMDMGTLP